MAMAQTEAKMAAQWLFATNVDVEDARAGNADADPQTPGPKRRSSAADIASPTKTAKLTVQTAHKTKSGEEVCGMYNDHKCASKTCRYKRLHVCNFKTKAGHACGDKSHTKEHHSR